MNILGIECPPGTGARGKVKVGELYDGLEVTIPIRILRGAKDGPTVSMTALLHGDEYNGMDLINGLFEQVDPAELSGALVGVPVANPFAFYLAKRISDFEYERTNLNRAFPGNPGGLNAERLAHTLFDGVIKHADYHLDFHEGGRDFMAKYIIVPQYGSDRVKETSHRMASWFGHGVPVLEAAISAERARLGRLGSSTIQATLLDKPALSIELGGGGRLWQEYVALGISGTSNILKGLGMLPGESVGGELPQHFATSSLWPRPDHGGIWRQSVDLGDVVEEGQSVGVVTDVFGDVVQELFSPFKAVILDTRHTAPIMPGEWTVHCGRIA